MTLEEKAQEWQKENCCKDCIVYLKGECNKDNICEGARSYLAGAKLMQKEIDRLEGQISLLLSCKDCPENKGGYICEKEYNDKCLSQKIQYIKELKEELAEWEKFVKDIQNRNEENYLKVCHKLTTELNRGIELADQLTKAKEIIKTFLQLRNGNVLDCCKDKECPCENPLCETINEKAEQFLKESK